MMNMPTRDCLDHRSRAKGPVCTLQCQSAACRSARTAIAHNPDRRGGVRSRDDVLAAIEGPGAGVGIVSKQADAVGLPHDAVLLIPKGLEERAVRENAGELKRTRKFAKLPFEATRTICVPPPRSRLLPMLFELKVSGVDAEDVDLARDPQRAGPEDAGAGDTGRWVV